MLRQMAFKVSWLFEGLSTLLTGKKFFARVQQFVPFKIGHLSKGFVTLIAWKRFLTSVDQLVSFEVFRSPEKFVTHTAMEGKVFSISVVEKFSSVLPLVLPQFIRSFECFVTLITFEMSFSRVSPQMAF